MRKNDGGRILRPPQKKGAKGPGAFARRALAFAMAVILSVGNVLGMFSPAVAYADDSYTHVFENGQSVQVHSDGTITGSATLSGNYYDHAAHIGRYGNMTMPDGTVLKAECYEVFIGNPDHMKYCVPENGTYPFTATKKPDGGYFILMHSENARPVAGSPVTGFVQRSYTTAHWFPDLDVKVSFTKVSADATVTDGNSEYAYAGATYDIYDASSNQKVATITTDESGHAEYKLSPNKSYYAIETKAPQGFKVNPNRIPFTTGNSASNEQLADDPGTVRLVVQKKDAATLGPAQSGATLEGAEFRIESISSPDWDPITVRTDATGKVIAKGIPFGKIVVTETKAPKGYKIDPNPKEFIVSYAQMPPTGEFELTPEDDFKENVIAFDLTIAKTKGGEDDDWEHDDGQADPAAGVKFEIVSNTTKQVVGTLTTNESGFASTEDAATVNPEAVSGEATYDPSKPWMGEGQRKEGIEGALPYDAAGYTVREVADTVPEGFDHVDDWQLSAEQMADGANLQFSVVDKTLNSKIQIVKTDAASGNTVPLAGFSFNILDAHGNKVSMTEAGIDTFTTDDSGWVTLPDRLPSGDYKVHEVAAQPPYLLNGEDVPFSVSDDHQDASALTVVKVTDKQAHGMAAIKKACAEDDCPWCEGDGGLPGAEFDVIATEDIVSPDGTVQAAAGTTVDHVTTGEDGAAKTKLLPLGDGSAEYAFVETKAPAGHQLDTTPIEFTLSWENDTTEVVYADAEAKDAPTETIVDKTIMGTDTPLPGAEFDLWPSFLELDRQVEDESKGSLSMRFDGIAEHGDDAGNAKISLEQSFSYAELSVKVPEGYSFSVTDGKGNVVPLADETVGVEPGAYTLEVADREGDKVDLGDDAALEAESGKAYSIEYSEGVLGWGAGLKIAASDMERASYDESDFSLDEDIASIEGVEPGAYVLAVGGYGDDAKLGIEIEAGSRSYAVASWDGGLSQASHLLKPGIQPVLDKVFDTFGIDLVTGEDGTIAIKHLPARCEDLISMMEQVAGEQAPETLDALETEDGPSCQIAWRIQEVEAPDGFLVDGEIREFTIHDDGTTEGEHVHTVPVEDDYTKVEISKRDIADEAEIEGAKLTVTDSQGKVVASWTSGKEPHRIDALAPGDYTLTEEMTPNAYDKAQSVDFTVLPTGEIQKVAMYDEPIKIAGEIDKRQEIADPTAEGHEENGDLQNKADVTVSDEGFFDYSLDYRSTSSTWTDEFTVEDTLDAANDGVAQLVGITTAQGWQDHDGKMNVWYTTDQTPADYVDASGANATLSDGHENPWLAEDPNGILGEDGRAIDYTGWRLWAADVSTVEATELKVADLGLAEGEHVTGIRFEYGRVEEGFTTRTGDWERENIKSGHDDLDDVQATHKGDGFAVPEHSIVTLADGSTLAMTDDELAAHEDGAGYMVDPDGDGAPEFVPFEHVKRVEEQQVAYAPAIVHMQVTDEYTEGTTLDNSAKVDLYRNGGGNDLEDHDEDFVTQVPKKIVSETPATPGKNLDQTGSNLLAAACACAAVAAAAGGAYAYRRRMAASAGTDPDPDGGDGASEAVSGSGDSADGSEPSETGKDFELGDSNAVDLDEGTRAAE